jgi:hypothetical protein
VIGTKGRHAHFLIVGTIGGGDMFTRQTRHGIVEEGFLTIAIVGTFVIGILRTQTAIETFMAIGTCCKLIITHDDDDDDECS